MKTVTVASHVIKARVTGIDISAGNPGMMRTNTLHLFDDYGCPFSLPVSHDFMEKHISLVTQGGELKLTVEVS
jgi:hypothetical protein